VITNDSECYQATKRKYLYGAIPDFQKNIVRRKGAIEDTDRNRWYFDSAKFNEEDFGQWQPFKRILPKSVEDHLKQGISFAGATYRFLGGKLSEGKREEEVGNHQFFHAYYFAEEGPEWPKISVEAVRAFLGDFGGEKAMKMNSRISLGFSGLFFGCTVLTKQILVRPDIYRNGGEIMTDGCGYIAVSTGKNIYHIVTILTYCTLAIFHTP
jgi:hypothetical protein